MKITVPQVVDARPTASDNLWCHWQFGIRFQGDEHESADDCVTHNETADSNLICDSIVSKRDNTTEIQSRT